MSLDKLNYERGKSENFVDVGGGTVNNEKQYFVLDGFLKFEVGSDPIIKVDGLTLVKDIDYLLFIDQKYTDLEIGYSGETLYGMIRFIPTALKDKEFFVSGKNFGTMVDNEGIVALINESRGWETLYDGEHKTPADSILLKSNPLSVSTSANGSKISGIVRATFSGVTVGFPNVTISIVFGFNLNINKVINNLFEATVLSYYTSDNDVSIFALPEITFSYFKGRNDANKDDSYYITLYTGFAIEGGTFKLEVLGQNNIEGYPVDADLFGGDLTFVGSFFNCGADYDAPAGTSKHIKNLPDLTAVETLSLNEDFDLVVYTAANGTKIKLGYDDVIPFKNDTGEILQAGTFMHLVNVTTVGAEYLATFEKTDASDWEKIQGTIGSTNGIVPIGATGFILPFGQIGGVDTSTKSGPAQMWLSATVPGDYTDVEPSSPDFSVSVGAIIDSAVDGNLFINITGDYKDVFNGGWDGAMLQTFNFTVSATGGVATGLLQNVNPANDLTGIFSGGWLTVDTTTAPKTIISGVDDGLNLVAGTDEITQTNYVYILKGDPTLRVSLTGFPATEHSKISTLDLQSVTGIEADGGARGNQNHNDHIKTESGNGHILHGFDWIRKQPSKADPRKGCEVVLDATAGNGYLTMTSGTVDQAHPQVIDSITMPTDSVMIANDFDTAFVKTTNLNTITKFSDGTTWSNKWGKAIVWVIANKTGQPDFLCINVPSAGYTSSADALLDINKTANYSIPIQYSSKAALLREVVFRVSSGTLTYSGDNSDLRGTIPSNIAGGGGEGGGVTSYLALTDTPSSFVGQAGKVSTVNSGETDLEFTAVLPYNGATDDLNMNGKNIGNAGDIESSTSHTGVQYIDSNTFTQLILRTEAGAQKGALGYVHSDNTLRISNGNSLLSIEAIVLDANGYVGFRKTNPDVPVDIEGLARSSATPTEIRAHPKNLVNVETMGELPFTIPPLGTVNVTSNSVSVGDNAFIVTYGLASTTNITTMSFGSQVGREEVFNSTSSCTLALITNGWSFENLLPTEEIVVTIKAVGETDIKQLILS